MTSTHDRDEQHEAEHQAADAERDETPLERLDRNWADILQELRVIQTGTQVLTGFLLTVPFQQGFSDLAPYQVDLYLGLVVTAVTATILGIAPVALHRGLWGKHAKFHTVHTADILMKCAIAAIGLTMAGAVLLIFDLVLSLGVGLAVAAVALILTIGLWVLLPLGLRIAHRR